jgi:TP901 family phage tail tape measure protein
LVSLTAGIATFRTAWSFAREAGEFDTEMARVQTISRATTQEFEALGEAAIEAGIRTQFAPIEAAGGLRVLAQQGLNATQAIDALVPVLDFAAAGGIQVAEAAEVAQGVLNAYGMEVSELTSVTDRLMRGTQLSALSADEFLTVMGRAASSGRVFGTNLDDVVIALGSLRSSGIPATVATTALTEAMRRLTTDAGSLETLERFNVEVENSEGQLRSVIDITQDFSGAISHLTEAQQAQLVAQTFGIRGMREFNSIANIQATRTLPDGTQEVIRGTEAIAHYRAELANASGTTEEFRRARLSTFEGQLVLLTGTLQTFSTVIGRTFGPIFRPIVLAFTETVNTLTQAWLAIPESIRTFIASMTLGGGAFAVVSGVIMIVVGAVVLLISVAGELLLIIAGVSAGIIAAMAPVIAIGAAIAGIAVGVFRAWQRDFGGLRTWTERWALRIRLIFRALRDIFTTGEISRGVWGALVSRESLRLREGLQAVNLFVNKVRLVWASFVARFRERWAELSPVFQLFRESVDELGGAFGNMIGGMAGRASEVPTGEFESFGATLADTVVGGFRQIIIAASLLIVVLARLIQAIESPAFQGFLSILTGIADMIIFITDAVSFLYNGLRDFQEVINPLAWITSGIQALTGNDVNAIPFFREEGEDRYGVNDFLSLVTGTPTPADTTRTEQGTARPGATAEGARGVSDARMFAMLEQLGAGEQRTTLNIENEMSIDGETLDRIIDEVELRSSTFEGGITTQNIRAGNRG